MKIRIAIVLVIAFSISTANAQISIQDIRVLLVVSNKAHQVYGATNVRDNIQDELTDKFNTANVDPPTLVLHDTNPELNDTLQSENSIFILGESPLYRNARNDAAADLVLFVLTAPLGGASNACGAAHGSDTQSIDLLADLTTGRHLINAETKYFAYVTTFHPNCLLGAN